MKSVWQEPVRRELKHRLAHLAPGVTPGWGTMTAPRMLLHIIQSFRSSTGDLFVKPKITPLKLPPLKQLVIYVLPFPKNVPTAPELLSGTPGDWAADVSRLGELIDQYATLDQGRQWPVHAAFGQMTGEQWGVLMYRHTDHHFRQFGV
jgi:hypothetical protein